LLLIGWVNTWLTVVAIWLGAISETTGWGKKNRKYLIWLMAGLMLVDLLGTKYGFLPEYLSWV